MQRLAFGVVLLVALLVAAVSGESQAQQGYTIKQAPIVQTNEPPPLAGPSAVQPAAEKPTPAGPREASASLHRVVIAAAVKQQRAGQMTRLELFRLRVAMLSPAFRDRVADLAVVQIVASAEADIPLQVDANGEIDKTAIDWEGLISFIERLMPLILQLIGLFGG